MSHTGTDASCGASHRRRPSLAPLSTLAAAQHVAFGYVVAGLDVLKYIEKAGEWGPSGTKRGSGKPMPVVRVTRSGELGDDGETGGGDAT